MALTVTLTTSFVCTYKPLAGAIKLSVMIYTTIMCRSPQCQIPCYIEIGLSVLEKNIFEEFLPYIDVTVILVM